MHSIWYQVGYSHSSVGCHLLSVGFYDIKKDNQIKGDEYFNSLKIEFSSYKKFVEQKNEDL